MTVARLPPGRWVTLAGPLALAGVLSACGEQAYPTGNEVLSREREFLHLGQPEQLRAATFATLQGLPRDEALRRLSKDGWTCSGATCQLSRLHRESWFSAHFGVVRAPGPAHSSIATWRVTLLADHIDTAEAILAETHVDFLEDPAS